MFEKILRENLNEEGKLNCLDAFKVAKKLEVEPKKMAKIADELNIKIDNCQLGSFGTLEFKTQEKEILDVLNQHLYKESNLFCEKAWEIAQDFSLKRVGSTMVRSELNAMYCQLGCFEEMKKCKSNKGKFKDAN